MHALAFGDLQSELWGVIWLPGDETVARLAVRAGTAAAQLDVALQSAAPSEPWSLEGEGISLEFAPTAGAHRGPDTKRQLTTHNQLCQVSGHILLEGSELEVHCLGLRSSTEREAYLGRVDSLRFLAGWLEPAFGFSLLALRPDRARGQDADAVSAVMIEDPAPPPIVDPRLSTTYADTGLPRRAGLELWLEEQGEDTAEEDRSHHYPRRAAGEVVGAGLGWAQAGFELHASLLHWHSHGRQGPGVYVLGQRQ